MVESTLSTRSWIAANRHRIIHDSMYPLVLQHSCYSYRRWPFLVSFPLKKCDFPYVCDSLRVGNYKIINSRGGPASGCQRFPIIRSWCSSMTWTMGIPRFLENQKVWFYRLVKKAFPAIIIPNTRWAHFTKYILGILIYINTDIIYD